MIASMTGFGIGEKKGKDFDIEFNIKSVNSRFFDCKIKLPSSFSIIENEIFNNLKESCKRGSIQVYCKIKPNNKETNKFIIDKDRLDNFYNSLAPVEKKFKNTIFNFNLSFDYIQNNLTNLENSSELTNSHKNLILASFNLALKDLLKSRSSEGKKIEKDINIYIKSLKKTNKEIIKLEVINKKEHFENLKKRINLLIDDNRGNIDDKNLYKELAIISDKYDLSEESTRINYHLSQFELDLKNEKFPGKKINFLCQEIFREINTIGSKSNNQTINHLVVDFKTNLEKIREQVQNII
ncbi:YicC family protein [Candidatus Marinimicrobia bacterium]|jgi:uncharacterized protein (TIGR00255 family)|nr:YicC family protein [Candidatus Neomarinimicrobiota bacterium]